MTRVARAVKSEGAHAAGEIADRVRARDGGKEYRLLLHGARRALNECVELSWGATRDAAVDKLQ